VLNDPSYNDDGAINGGNVMLVKHFATRALETVEIELAIINDAP
jgi:hypothetical protein